jgi:hypothetical protein
MGDFGWKLSERRSVQIKHRKAQNYEIMLLDETKKYFGMPAAPRITRISEDETNHDLALMRVYPLKNGLTNSNASHNMKSTLSTIKDFILLIHNHHNTFQQDFKIDIIP